MEFKLFLLIVRLIIVIVVGYFNKLKGVFKSVRGDRRGLFVRVLWG